MQKNGLANIIIERSVQNKLLNPIVERFIKPQSRD